MKKHELLPAVEQIVRAAGDVLISYFRTNNLTYERKAFGDIVTQADKASEHLLIEQLGTLFPQARVFAEESGASGVGDYCWVIDPLDGTTNFSRGLSYFCISVALTFQDKPILACVYQPIGDQMFCAFSGGGATLNGKTIGVSDKKGVDQAFVSASLPYKRDDRYQHLIGVFGRIAQKSYAIRSFGAAALDQANVACGRLDAAIFENLGWWDVAAGMLLVSEAGGYVADYQGRLIGPDYHSFIATNAHLYQELQAIVRQ